VEDIKAMQRRLSQTRKQIESLIASIQSKPEGLTCAENTDRVLAQFKEVTLERDCPRRSRLAFRPTVGLGKSDAAAL
jgi:hypothetical protein